MQIRQFKVADTDAVIGLWQDCGLVVPWNDARKDIERKMTTGSDLFLVGELEGTVIASAMGGYDGHRGWINYLAVHPHHQHSGYGRQLMTDLEQRLIARGCPKINLQIRTSNDKVRKFYAAIGYKEDAVVSYGKRLIQDG